MALRGGTHPIADLFCKNVFEKMTAEGRRQASAGLCHRQAAVNWRCFGASGLTSLLRLARLPHDGSTQHKPGGDMTDENILKILEETQAIRHGHFELSSGLHSDTYVQCASILQFPEQAESLGRALAGKFKDLQIGAVASPAIGGILIGQEVARALGTRAIFAERDASGHLTLRRNFHLESGERVLVIEDVWTTGGSTRETVAVIEEFGGIVVAAGAIIDRTGGGLELPVSTEALLRMKVASYRPEECPQCRTGSRAERPGSHFPRA